MRALMHVISMDESQCLALRLSGMEATLVPSEAACFALLRTALRSQDKRMTLLSDALYDALQSKEAALLTEIVHSSSLVVARIQHPDRLQDRLAHLKQMALASRGGA